MSASAPDRLARGGRRAVMAVGVGAVTIDSALLGLIAPLLPDIERRTGAGDAALGLALAAYAVPIALLSIPLGRAADSIGRRALLVAGLLIVAVGSLLIAVSDSIAVLLAARAVQGIGPPRAGSPLSRWSPTPRRRIGAVKRSGWRSALPAPVRLPAPRSVE